MRHRSVSALAAAVLAGLAVAGLVSSAPAAARTGVEVTLRPVPSAGTAITQSALDGSVAIMRARLARLGVRGTVTRQPGSRLIVLHLHDGASAARKDARIISDRGAIAFYDFPQSLLPPSIDRSRTPVGATSLYALLHRAHASRQGHASAYYLFDVKTERTLAGPSASISGLLQKYGSKAPPRTQVLAVPANAVVVSCDAATALFCPGPNGGVGPAPKTTYYYLFKHNPSARPPSPTMTGADLKSAQTRLDKDPATGQPVVTIQFTRRGDRLFHTMTRAEAARGRTLNTPQGFAIVVDDQIHSYPEIDYTVYPDGIDPTRSGAEISGLASSAEAKKLALVLRTGELPLKFVIASERLTS